MKDPPALSMVGSRVVCSKLVFTSLIPSAAVSDDEWGELEECENLG